MIRFPSFGADAAAQPEPPQGKQAAHPPHPLDALTGGVFSANTSGERAQRVRAWLATEPDYEHMQEVFKELSAKDKGAAKALREKLDDIKRSRGQDALIADWAAKAGQLLQAARFNIADGMAWQRDAAKAGAPLSREPLCTLKQQLAERIKSIEDLQTRVQVQREAAVLLAQRIEILSTKSWQEADAAQPGLHTDVQHWKEQAAAIQADAGWSSVDAKYASQLDAAGQQLQLVAQAFSDALESTRKAAQDATSPLPSVPMWAEEIAQLRGTPLPAPAPSPADPAEQARAAERAAATAQKRERAHTVAAERIQALEAELAKGNAKAAAAAAHSLRQWLKDQRKWLDSDAEAKAGAVLTQAGELEGWQRWRADQIRQELVDKAEALIHRPASPPDAADAAPADAPTANTDATAHTEAEAETPTGAEAAATAEAAPQEPHAAAPADLPPADMASDTASDTATDAEAHTATDAVANTAADTASAAAADAPPTAAQDAESAPSDTDAASADAPAADANAAPPERIVTRHKPVRVVPAARPLPTSKHSPRKLQDMLRQLREQWRETDQGGAPNHALWKRFDAACNEAYRIVDAWLHTMKEQASEHKAARLALLDEITQWGQQLAERAQHNTADWKSAQRDLFQFTRRWREAGHLSEKVFAELQPRWKAAMDTAAAPLEAAQKASARLRHAMIEEATALGAEATLRIDAVKALQQRWQQEAQHIPLERKQEQKLWDAFRKPIDDAFQRKTHQREQTSAAMSERDQTVLHAAQALEAASATGNAQAIQAAMQALEAAMKAPPDTPASGTTDQASAAPAQAATTPEPAAAQSTAEEGAPRPPAASASTHRPAIAVRGDDRPQARAAAGARPDHRNGRDHTGRGRPERLGDKTRPPRRDERSPRAPRLSDPAFRAQRDAVEHAQAALRKLQAQAQGEIVGQLIRAWEQRTADAVPTAGELGKRITNATRQIWATAIGTPARDNDDATDTTTALLRLEMAADTPTPAEHLSARRALQLQLLTRRNDPAPADTWVADVGTVLSGAYHADHARRLHNILRALMRK